MQQTDKQLPRRRRAATAVGVLLTAGLAVSSAHAATSTPIGSGHMEYAQLVGGPATLTMRTLAIAPGETLGWHRHPGIGAYTVVVSGTLVVEDGCGTEVTYTQGQAFVEPPNRIHRGKNLTDAPVVTAQTFLVPAGTPTSVSHATAACGVPQTVNECKNDGWRAFNYPDTFISQGECIEFVLANP